MLRLCGQTSTRCEIISQEPHPILQGHTVEDSKSPLNTYINHVYREPPPDTCLPGLIYAGVPTPGNTQLASQPRVDEFYLAATTLPGGRKRQTHAHSTHVAGTILKHHHALFVVNTLQVVNAIQVMIQGTHRNIPLLCFCLSCACVCVTCRFGRPSAFSVLFTNRFVCFGGVACH